MPNTNYNLLQKAIRIRQFVDGTPNNDGFVIEGNKTYKDVVLNSQPVWAYIMADRANAILNVAVESANSPTTDATLSSDVLYAPPLYANNNEVGAAGLFFDCDNTTGTPIVTVPNFPDIETDGTGSYTFEFLFNIQDFYSGECTLFFSNSLFFSNAYGIIIAPNAVRISHNYFAVDSSFDFTTGITINPNQTYHLVLTVDSSNNFGEVTLYLNGQQVGATTLQDARLRSQSSQPAYIGGADPTLGGGTNALSQFFSGTISAACRYDRILLGSEVLAHYNAINNTRGEIKGNYHRFNDNTNYSGVYMSNFANTNFTATKDSAGTYQYEEGSTSYSYGGAGTISKVGKVQNGVTGFGKSGNAVLLIPEAGQHAGLVDSGGINIFYDEAWGSIWFSPFGSPDDETYYNLHLLSVNVSRQNNFCLDFFANSDGTVSLTYFVSGVPTTVTTSEPFENWVMDGSNFYNASFFISKDIDVLYIYLNGEVAYEDTNFTVNFDEVVTGANRYVGFDGSVSPSASFYGIISDVILYSEPQASESGVAFEPRRAKGFYDHSLILWGGQVDHHTGYWSLNNITGTTVTDDSEYGGNDGTLINSPTRVNNRFDEEETAVEFDGVNQAIQLPQVAALQPANFTVAGWVKNTTQQGVYILTNYENSGGAVSGFAFGSTTFAVGDNVGNVLGTNYLRMDFLRSVQQDNNWHHYAASYDGTTMKAYIDGVLVAEEAFAITVGYDTGVSIPYIGARYGGTTTYSAGCIDDVRIYDFVLNEEEILYLYNIYSDPKPSDYYIGYDFGNRRTGAFANSDINGTNSLLSVIGSVSGEQASAWSEYGLKLNATRLDPAPTPMQIQTFSVSFYVGYQRESDTTGDQFLMSLGRVISGNWYGWGIWKDASDQLIHFGWWDGVGENLSFEIATTEFLKANSMLHVAVTVEQLTNVVVYINGVSVGSGVPTTSIVYEPTPTQNDWFFGCSPQPSRYITSSTGRGSIDQIRFFERALTSDEVLSLSNRRNLTILPEPPAPPPTYDPLSVDIDVASITETVANDTQWFSGSLTATPTGGSGQFTYAWSSDGVATLASNPVPNVAIFTYTGNQETINETITCTITDVGNNNDQASDTCPINITFGTTNDYIAYWNADSSSVTGFVMADQTANNHDATFVATPTFGTGVDGNSVVTSASQYANVVDNAALKTTSFSFACWMKPSALNSLGTLINNGVNLGSSNYQGMYVTYANTSDQLTVLLGLGTGSVQGTDFELASTVGNITEGDWNHVCVTYDNAFIKLYVNAVERANVAWANGIAFPQTNNIRLGAQNLGSPAFSPFAQFDGELDEIKWWDRRLTASEVTELYNIQGTPSAPPAPFEVTISPNGISDVIFPIAPYTSQTITATPANGSGSYTYQWAYTSQQSANFVIDNPTSATTTVSSTGETAGEYIDTLQVTVTDTGNGNVQVTDSITIFTNWGAV